MLAEAEARKSELRAAIAALTASPQAAPDRFASMADIRAARYARELGGREATTAEAYEAGYQHGVEVGKRVRAAIDELSAASPQVQGGEADERRCHCCGETFDRCRESYIGTTAEDNKPFATATPQRAPGVIDGEELLRLLAGIRSPASCNGEPLVYRASVLELVRRRVDEARAALASGPSGVDGEANDGRR
jgi:hypothetical protein